MSENRSKMAAGVSTAAAIAAAVALINSRKVGATPRPGDFTLPDEFVQLMVAIAATADSIANNLVRVIDGLAKLAINVQGFPANARGVRTFTVNCAIANRAYQGSDLAVPEGMSLIIKSYPTNPVLSLVRVASSLSDASNINSSWPLMPNEGIGYQVQNADEIYVSATVAGALVVFTVEKAEFKA